MESRELAQLLEERFPGVVAARGEVTVTVQRDELLEALRYLREESDLSYRFLSDLSAADWPGQDPRFWLAYHLYSMEHRHRVRVKVGVPADDPRVASVISLYPTADWHEREVFDFFGVVFEGHSNLARIIMPDDWEGHPLRKDYGLGGVPTRYRHGAYIPPVDTRKS